MKKIVLSIENFVEQKDKVFLKCFLKQTNNKIFESNISQVDTSITELELPNSPSLIQKYGEGSELLIAIWTGDNDIKKEHELLNSFIVKLDSNVVQIVSTKLIKKEDIFFFVDETIEVDAYVKIKNIPIKSNITNNFYDRNIFKQKEFKLFKTIDNKIAPFDFFIFLKKGNYKEDLKLITNDGVENVLSMDINVKELVSNNKEIKLSKIDHSYCFWTPLYYRNTKPLLPISILKNSELSIKKVEVYINDNFIYNIPLDNINDSLTNIDISNANIGENSIELIFHTENEYKELNKISSKKNIVVSDIINAELGVEYNSDKGNYTINLSAEQETLDKIESILWRVTYSSFVMQNILNVSGSDEKITTDIVFEKMTNNETNSIDVELKQLGTYYIEAYLIEKNGSFKKIKTNINSSNKTDDTGDYSIGDKINFNVISKNNKVPVYELFAVTQDKFINLGVHNMNNMFDNIYGTEFTVEENNCVYVMKIDKQIKLFKVGQSSNIHIAYKPSYNKDTKIEFVLKDFEGNELESGSLLYGNKGIMYAVTDKDKHGLIKIGNKFKRI